MKALEEAQIRLDMNKNLLPEINKKITPIPNKRIVFDDSDDDDSNENELNNNNNNNTLLEFIDYKKNSLFDSDNDNSDDNDFENENDDEDDDDQKRFGVKKQFEGEKGRKLFEMQKRIENGDDRFKIDERFMDSDDENEKGENENENDESIENEQERAMNILTEMFGTTVKQKSYFIYFYIYYLIVKLLLMIIKEFKDMIQL